VDKIIEPGTIMLIVLIVVVIVAMATRINDVIAAVTRNGGNRRISGLP
jgi:hypothetical protein